MRRSAWKLGGTNFRSQKKFGNQVPLFGSIPSESVYASGELIPFSSNTCIELELAVLVPDRNKDELQYALCFEIPQERSLSKIANLNEILLDRCGAHMLVIQNDFQFCDQSDLMATVFKTKKNSVEIQSNSLENLIYSPKELLDDFLIAANQYGVNPLPGEIVALGGLGECFPVSPGEIYEARNNILGELKAVFS